MKQDKRKWRKGKRMELYSSNKDYKLYHGNMLDMLEVIEPNTIDSIITDPPYELNFMNKGWDNSGIAFQPSTWQKCYEVLKPGGYLLAFGGSRTFHRIACAIEDAGFEIRDTIMWLYGSGFPKSMNIGLALDKKNGVDNRTGNIKTDGKATDSNSGCYNMNNGKDTMKKEYEERIATNQNDYLKLIEEELKKQGVENIEWK
jgi:DNA modification methylase